MTVVNAWSGALTADGFTVVAKVTGTSTRLAVADNAALSGPVFTSAVTPTAQGISRHPVTGLDPDTQWYWAIEENGVLQTAMAGRSRTVVASGTPYSFTFAAGTCAGGAGDTAYPVAGALLPHQASDHPAFDAVRNQAPLFIANAGDLHYYNITRTGDTPTDGGTWPADTPDSWRRAYDDVLLSRQGLLYRQVPIQYVWDNHDSAQPLTDDGSSNRHAAGMVNAAAVYRERVPSYPLANPTTGGIYHSFQIGRVLWIASDTRYYRDASTDTAPRTYLGSAQLSWMDSVLASSSAEFCVWQQTQDWTNQTVDGHGWGAYSEERDQVVQMFGDHGFAGKMMSFFGDTHAMAMDTGATNVYGGFPLLLAGPFDSPLNVGPNYDLGRKGSSTGGVRGQWATVRIDDPGPWIKVTLNGWYWS